MSKETEKLTQRRNSPEVQSFKKSVLEFFNQKKVEPVIQYRIIIDLAKKMDMPFYKDNAKNDIKKYIKENALLKSVPSSVECAKKIVEYLNGYDVTFADELLTNLIRQQEQTFRKIYPCSKKQKENKLRYGKNSVMEHPVPASYSKDLLMSYIKAGDIDKAKAYIDYLSDVPQIALPEKEDNRLNGKLKYSMPEGWNWESDNKFARYIVARIDPMFYK